MNNRQWRRYPLFLTAGAFVAACSSSPTSPSTSPGKPSTNDSARFEAASVVVPVGEACTLHPEGNADPKEALAVNVDSDGVARFRVVRPTQAGAVERLQLDCTAVDGKSASYPVDLRAEATFTPRPFDPTGLDVRPALDGDPLRFSQSELVQKGYGWRPDPAIDSVGFARWLKAAKLSAHFLRSAKTPTSPVALGTHAMPRRPAVATNGQSATTADGISPDIISDTYLGPWTGAELTGDYHVGATPNLTTSYAKTLAWFTVPTAHPSAVLGNTAMTVWTGLETDNLFQAIVDVNTTSTIQINRVHRQVFAPQNPNSSQGAGVSFTPVPGDEVMIAVWYCDAAGNLNLDGGYACSTITMTTGPGTAVVWDCSVVGNSNCSPYWLASGDLANGFLGRSAEFVVEVDTGQPKDNPYDNDWPQFDPITMSGIAYVVQGPTNVIKAESAATDPGTRRLLDWTVNVPNNINVSINTLTGDVTWTPIPWTASNSTANIIKGEGSHLCLDVVGGGTSAGQRVDLAPCTGAKSQLWESRAVLGGEGILINHAAGLCLDVVNGATSQGSALQVWTCTGNANQVWEVATQNLNHSGSEIVGQGSGMCVNVVGGATAAGSPLQIWPCPTNGTGTSNEQWAMIAEQEIVGQGSNLCLNVTGGATTPGSAVQIWSCAGSGTNELWAMNSLGQIQGVGSGLCLDVVGGATAEGSLVDIAQCSSTATSQQWVWNKGQLQGVGSGLCLNVIGGATSAGTRLQIWPCQGTPNEIWGQTYQ